MEGFRKEVVGASGLMAKVRHGAKRSPLGEIHTIAGGLAGGSLTSFGRKAYARGERYEEVYIVEQPIK